MPLQLTLPDYDPTLAKSVETNPKKLKEWLIALPTGNVQEAGRLLSDSLHALNRVKLDADDRARLLNEYQTTLELLSGSFELCYAASGLPLKDEARAAAMLVRTLWLELAIGWKRALQDRSEKRFVLNNAKVLPGFVLAVLHCYWRLYQVSCRLYMTLPPGVWLDAHQLFLLGAEGRFLDEPKENGAERCIGGMYKRLLVLALADPLRFAGPEVEKVLELAESYAHLAHFQPMSKLSNAPGFFLVELEADKPAQYIGSKHLEFSDGKLVLLDTQELGQKLKRVEKGIEEKAPTANDRSKVLAWLELVRRVARQWTITPQRLYQRIPAEASVDIAAGLRAATFTLHQGQPIIPVLDDGSIPEATQPHPADLELSTWAVINESPGGYAVRLQSSTNEILRAGEIVALRSGADAGWLTCSVRWLQQHEDGAIEMGLQVLSARAVPLLLRPSIGAEHLPFLPALLLPEIPALKQPARIAASKGVYTPLRELVLVNSSGEKRVRGSKLCEQQMGYDLFEFQASTE
ncbi:hypothetical protein [Chitinilyticum piscinae]|uniref:Molecular chaperone n=1 Tax=Chitinilyticum piscinae TaxID=2866724 RepID=A0A8J7K2P6_9NEIS|nr:hypothetical protein [Chitinilyticum piscinae]MBE9610327.1 hypothetical protein [Chitinilyticum piscinae]